jgi:hypothetical protein
MTLPVHESYRAAADLIISDFRDHLHVWVIQVTMHMCLQSSAIMSSTDRLRGNEQNGAMMS